MGWPILRPLLWAFSADRRAAAVEDEVLLGDALLAAPVCHPGRTERDVYLPEGRWYDWWTGGRSTVPSTSGRRAVGVPPVVRSRWNGRPLAILDDNGRTDDDNVTLRVFLATVADRSTTTTARRSSTATVPSLAALPREHRQRRRWISLAAVAAELGHGAGLVACGSCGSQRCGDRGDRHRCRR